MLCFVFERLTISSSAPLPPTPPQFELVYNFDEKTQIDPTGVYLDSTQALFDLSQQPWSGGVDLTKLGLVAVCGCHVSLTLHELAQGLQPGHIILAIYDTVLRMYNGQPGFCAANCQVYLRAQRIGLITMIPGRLQKVPSSSQNDTMTESEGTEGSLSLVNGIGTLTDDSGVIIDSSDPRFTISWTLNGKSIPAQDLFSAAVDGIASTAQYEWNQICSHAPGVSFPSNVAFHIRPYYSCKGLLCGWIVKTFGFLVLKVVRAQRKFQEMDLTLNWQGEQVRSGYIMKLSSLESHGGNGTDGIASS